RGGGRRWLPLGHADGERAALVLRTGQPLDGQRRELAGNVHEREGVVHLDALRLDARLLDEQAGERPAAQPAAAGGGGQPGRRALRETGGSTGSACSSGAAAAGSTASGCSVTSASAGATSGERRLSALTRSMLAPVTRSISATAFWSRRVAKVYAMPLRPTR